MLKTKSQIATESMRNLATYSIRIDSSKNTNEMDGISSARSVCMQTFSIFEALIFIFKLSKRAFRIDSHFSHTHIILSIKYSAEWLTMNYILLFIHQRCLAFQLQNTLDGNVFTGQNCLFNWHQRIYFRSNGALVESDGKNIASNRNERCNVKVISTSKRKLAKGNLIFCLKMLMKMN